MPPKVTSYIANRILEGEHLMQDFKFGITDSRKIARSMVSFANTQGGRLLIGVKDNGTVAGVRSEEEYYMIESAAQLFSLPEIPFESKVWKEDGKTVLEVWIPASAIRPHYVKELDGKPIAYVRVNDQNVKAHPVQLAVWQKQKQLRGTLVRYSDAEAFLLKYLQNHPHISQSEFRKKARIPNRMAIETLSNLLLFDVIDITFQQSPLDA